MKVVGLLSGGKDSIFNLLHCIAQGHEPIAFASLGPESGKDELDSYMYQTVGHSGLKSIAEAAGLPLVIQTIRGNAINTEIEYGSRATLSATEGDETEDLYLLLQNVQSQFPEVEGVACGAILSNYQRVRVEQVCSRLKLVPLAYLWERDQEELLQEMINAQMGSIFVKVAGAGLSVSHLGKTLAEMQTTLYRLNEQFELHFCGEGGEYETFTIDCPLFKKRLVLDKFTTVISNEDRFSTVAHLHLDEIHLEEKEETLDIKRLVSVPPFLDDQSIEILDFARRSYQTPTSDEANSIDSKIVIPPTRPGIYSNGYYATFSEVCSANNASIEEEVHACFRILTGLLHSKDLSLESIAHLTLYLSNDSMALFPQINAVYSTYFGSSPPTRACVSIRGFSPGTRLKIEGIAQLIPGHRSSLHVQSLSYWAGANIGPYSQSIATSTRLYVAGQIPLIPASLTLLHPTTESFPEEAVLALQHTRRIVKASDNRRWKGSNAGGICWISECEYSEWQKRVLTCRTCREQDTLTLGGPFLFVSAAVLPKGARVEWQTEFARQISQVVDDEEEEEVMVGSTMGIFKPCDIDNGNLIPSDALLIKVFITSHELIPKIELWISKQFQNNAPPVSYIGCHRLAFYDGLNVEFAVMWSK